MVHKMKEGGVKNSKWIQDADLVKGGLHRDLNVPMGKNIPVDKIKKAAKAKNEKIRKRAQFALNVRKK